MSEKKYIGIYYPDSIIKNQRSMATFCLFFDEIHLISPSDDSKDPTSMYKNLPDKFYINVFGKPSEEETKRTTEFYQFVLDNSALLKEVLFYEPHLLNSSITKIMEKLIGGHLTVEELQEFASGETPELKAMNEFNEKYPNIQSDIVFKAAVSSMKLAKDNDWVLIGDDPDAPIPVFSKKEKNVKLLTSILAEECLQVAMPSCVSMTPEQMLEARDKLKDQLIPFRMTMQKLAKRLKQSVQDSEAYFDIKREAQFIAESEVEPAIYEIKRRIEMEKNRFWIKVFGKTISWIPFIAKSFLAPTPDNIYKSIEKIYGDVGDIVESGNNVKLVREPGISYLLSAQKVIEDISS